MSIVRRQSVIICEFVGLLLVCALSLGASVERTGAIPVLLLPEESNPCECPPSVDGFYAAGGAALCWMEGAPQPCFNISYASDPAPEATDTPGKCQLAAPSACSSKGSCSFNLRKIVVDPAACAGENGGCGTPPYVVVNPWGEVVGDPFDASGYGKLYIQPGNRPCDTTMDYDVRVLDSTTPQAQPVAIFRLRVSCGRCPASYSQPN